MRFSTDFKVGEDCARSEQGGIWIAVFARLQRAVYTKVKNGGFFSREEWDFPPETTEWMIQFNFLGGVYGYNFIDPEQTSSGYSFFNNDFDKLETGKDFFCLNHSPAETVNVHQWHGWNPIVYEDRGIRRTEPAQWEIASVDQLSGQRHILFRSHNNRDDIFQLQSLWNKALFNFKDVCTTYRDFCQENFLNKRWTLDHLAEGEELNTGIELYNAAVRRIKAENYPIRYGVELDEIDWKPS